MKCLLTTLKSSVTDATLPKFGVLKVEVNATGLDKGRRSAVIGCKSASIDNPFTIKVVNGSAKLSLNPDGSNPVAELTFTSKLQYTYIYFLEGEYDVEISSKYGLDDFSQGVSSYELPNAFTIDVNQLSYNDEIWRFRSIYSPLTTGDIASFARSQSKIQMIDVTGSALYGNIANLANCTLIEEINLYKNAGIYGSLESMCEGMVAAGRESGIISCDLRGTQITYGDALITTKLTITFSSFGYSVA
jgi:hypothetical protein